MDNAGVMLDPDLRSDEVQDFEDELRRKVVGQDRAVRQLARIYQVFRAGIFAPGRPLTNLLLLGPTGSGKTRIVEATAGILLGNERAVLKIDCAEFQHSHEISKLIGSPPGYLGHRETHPLITQEALDQHYTDSVKLSLVLFDEIEKASDSLWQLLLGILDKATLTLGDNQRVDFSHSMIFMTSNLGSQEMAKLVEGGLGFAGTSHDFDPELDQKIYRAASEAARRKFSPEFMNRIDRVIVFRSLQPCHMEEILDIELDRVQERIMQSAADQPFIFRCLPEARKFLISEGADPKFGARHLKRAIERHLVVPLSNLLATAQIRLGDVVTIDFNQKSSKLAFFRQERAAVAGRGLAASTSWASAAEPAIAGLLTR
ncbi:MAG: ATP-dependent Clp protease ATP-binding subunit [Acidobacteriota bacterium]|nr:ATP-dependent Clp protease ATP-binding subunit [Acidobacteriota bacterium]